MSEVYDRLARMLGERRPRVPKARRSFTADAEWERDPSVSVDRWPEEEQMRLDDPSWTPPVKDEWKPRTTLDGPVS